MKYLWILLIALSTSEALAALRINSAVSENFPDGLQARFIKYIAEQMGAEANISTMPFARRLIELDHCTLDLMVGVADSAPIGEHTIRLQPPYDFLKNALFVLAKNQAMIATPEDLLTHTVSITRRTNTPSSLENIPVENVVLAHSLEQKIDLLLKGRVDAFMHLLQSSELRLHELNLQDKVVLANYQPQHEYKHYVAICVNSWLYKHKAKIEAIIAQGVENNDFTRIRTDYYRMAGQ